VLSKETHETVIRFAPPLTITPQLIDRAVAVFRRVAMDKHAELGLGAREPATPATPAAPAAEALAA
jgi:ornithine--oxo-acid transaminase